MASSVREHPLSLSLLSALLFAFSALSLWLAVTVSEQVLIRIKGLEAGWPMIIHLVLTPVRALGALGVIGLAFSFPALLVVALLRRWSSLRFLTAAFGTFVLLGILLVLVAIAALIPFSIQCASGAARA